MGWFKWLSSEDTNKQLGHHTARFGHGNHSLCGLDLSGSTPRMSWYTPLCPDCENKKRTEHDHCKIVKAVLKVRKTTP